MRLLSTTLFVVTTRLIHSASSFQPAISFSRSSVRNPHPTTTLSSRTMTSRRITELFSSATSNAGPEQSTVHRILCYGDSLMAGTSISPWELYPYAPHLEKALATGNPSNAVRYVVRHRGMPGWLASAMVDAADDAQFGLRAAIRGIQNPSLSCVIILAGTNDLGYADNDAQETVLAPIRALHEMAWNEGVPRTIAVAIPPSGYQARVADASFLAMAINQELKSFCEASNGRATFVPFPFDYDGGDNWSPDGLHFSPQGYQVLGEYLKDPVLQVLNGVGGEK